MKRAGMLCAVLVGFATMGLCQPESPNVVLVTIDGFRWQELFEGADSVLLNNKNYTKDERAMTYWHSDAITRRKILMPFVWSEIVEKGQLLGNRKFNNRVDCDNPHWLSYPGYNEMLTGFIDRRIRSNDKFANPNMTVFEYISRQPGYSNSAAAFTTWGVFPYIFREDSSGIYVNAGDDSALTSNGSLTEGEHLLNELQGLLPNAVTERHDVFTCFFALEYMKRKHPKVVFIGLDETDSYAHGGMYDQYLFAATRSDAIIRKLWNFIQADPFYKDNTTLIITTDHGRGRGYNVDKLSWRSHGRLAFGSGEVFVMAIGGSVPALGEIKTYDKSTLSQIASTVAAVLGMTYTNDRPVAKPFESIVPTPETVVTTSH